MRFYRIVEYFSRFYWVCVGWMGFHRVFTSKSWFGHGFTEFYWVFVVLISFDCVFTEFKSVLLGITGLLLVLTGL